MSGTKKAQYVQHDEKDRKQEEYFKLLQNNVSLSNEGKGLTSINSKLNFKDCDP